MILTGWKEIARYMGCGVRTVQRWEGDGLPIRRPSPGKRSHVIAESEQLDSWVRNSAFWRAEDKHILVTIERNAVLREEIKERRMTLRSNMRQLKSEMAALRAKRHRPKE